MVLRLRRVGGFVGELGSGACQERLPSHTTY